MYHLQIHFSDEPRRFICEFVSSHKLFEQSMEIF